MASFITGLSHLNAIGLSGNNLFVANTSSGTVGEYDATTGAAINANFITGLFHASVGQDVVENADSLVFPGDIGDLGG